MHLGPALLLLLALFGATRLVALDWDEKQISRTARPGTPEVRAEFTFKNTSAQTVHVLDLSTSCGCTRVRASAPEIAPGATGAIHAIFTVGKRTGRQQTSIYLLTSESDDMIELQLRVTIGDLGEASKSAPARADDTPARPPHPSFEGGKNAWHAGASELNPGH